MKNLLFIILTLLLHPSLFAARSLPIGPAARPATIKLPFAYNADKKYPVILMLHGLGNSAQVTDLLLGLSFDQDRLGYILILPEGTRRPSDQKSFWNASPECCDNGETGVDDSGYLKSLLVEAVATYSIDPSRVYVYGHSNGGFMAHRMACDNDGLIKGIVSVAGAVTGDPALCQTQTPVHVLQIHGTDDEVVFYDTRNRDVRYPSSNGTVDFWADRNSCQTANAAPRSQNLTLIQVEPTTRNGRFALDGNLRDFLTLGFGSETDTYTYSSCAGNTRSALWSVQGAGHAPVFFLTNFVQKTLNFLENKR